MQIEKCSTSEEHENRIKFKLYFQNEKKKRRKMNKMKLVWYVERKCIKTSVTNNMPFNIFIQIEYSRH